MGNRNYIKAGILLFFMFITACESPTELEKPTSIYGVWQLRILSGGFAGINDTIDISENNSLVNYKADNAANFYYNDSLVLSSPFSISRETTMYSNGEKEIITYSKTGIEDVIFYLNKDSLLIGENGVVDGFTRLYIKKP